MSNKITALEALSFIHFNSHEYDNLDKHYNIIEKSLKVLEIINKKAVEVRYFKECKSLKEYNSVWVINEYKYRKLTQEEYDLLKEVIYE